MINIVEEPLQKSEHTHMLKSLNIFENTVAPAQKVISPEKINNLKVTYGCVVNNCIINFFQKVIVFRHNLYLRFSYT